jgi:hypothetical protein
VLKRRGLVAVVAAVGALVVAGCAATTDPPSDVTASSARLQAKGRTDSTPAHYFFQYSVNPNALGTGFGQQTPTRGPIPAGVQTSGGGLVAFSEAVTGLRPGTTYYYRVCGGDGQTSGDVCAQVRSFTTPDGAVFDQPGSFSWTVPAGVTRVQFDVSGAQGGAGNSVTPGGRGAHVRATVAVQPGDSWTVIVGGRGGDAAQPKPSDPAFDVAVAGGAGGSGLPGGRGGDGSVQGGSGAGGGGGSLAQTGSGSSLRRLVAGGGGGSASIIQGSITAPPSGEGAFGGAGGLSGAAGQDGIPYCCALAPAHGGGGGTATAGGAGGTPGGTGFGAGANGGALSGGAGGTDTRLDLGSANKEFAGAGASGGGGGLFGGGGGESGSYNGTYQGSASGFRGGTPAAGGGGSSFINPSALCSSTVDTGVQSGDGAVTITYNPGPC